MYAVQERVRIELSQVSLNKRKPIAQACARQIRFLHVPRVKIRERINANDIVALFEQCLRQVGSNEAGATSYKVATQEAILSGAGPNSSPTATQPFPSTLVEAGLGMSELCLTDDVSRVWCRASTLNHAPGVHRLRSCPHDSFGICRADRMRRMCL